MQPFILLCGTIQNTRFGCADSKTEICNVPFYFAEPLFRLKLKHEMFFNLSFNEPIFQVYSAEINVAMMSPIENDLFINYFIY